MVWYRPTERPSIEDNIGSLLERALRSKPNYIAVLDAYCRFLNTTNQFVETLIVCTRSLSFDPWNGVALYHLGLAQIHLGRFEDARRCSTRPIASTQAVSRWTWTLGVGRASMLIGASEIPCSGCKDRSRPRLPAEARICCSLRLISS